MSLCDNCVQPVHHANGVAGGTIQTIGGIECYVATPSQDSAADKVLLFLTNVYGSRYINNQLLGDNFAAHGYRVVMPMLFREPVTEELADSGKLDLAAWLCNNDFEYSEPRIRKVLAALRANGVTQFAVAGFCYGARLAFNLAFECEVSPVIINHPTFLRAPQDFDIYLTKSTAPLLINSCEFDEMFPAEAVAAADNILGGGKFVPGYLRTYWEGCEHGFTVREDVNNPKAKAGKEGAFQASAAWLKKYL